MGILDVQELLETEDTMLFEDTAGPPRTFPAVASHRIRDLCMLDQRKDVIDLNVARTHLFNEGRLTERQIFKLIEDSNRILRMEPNLLRIDRKAVVIGDIHGQFYDLVALLNSLDLETETLVFLGDYVDRGLFSTEAYFYLLLLKIHHPGNVYLLRGNHESRKMTEYFTFKEECRQKYSLDVYEKCLESFNSLPLAAVILGKAYCSHGGISPSIHTLEQIDQMDRFRDVEIGTPMCDILWADPHPAYNKTEPTVEFVQNFARRCSYYYTYTGVTRFLERNGLSCIIRGHEVQPRGHMIYRSFRGVPSVITVFSAPNYCDSYGNLGAILRFDGHRLEIRTFGACQHPFCLPNNMDGVNWSYPFIAEKVSEFYLDLLKELDVILGGESSSELELLVTSEVEKTQNFACSMAVIRSERENLCELEDEESEMISATAIKVDECGMNEFEDVKVLDALNETDPEETGVNGITMDVSPSLAPPITKDIGETSLDRVLDDINVVVLDGGDMLKVDTGDREVEDEDMFVCWCF